MSTLMDERVLESFAIKLKDQELFNFCSENHRTNLHWKPAPAQFIQLYAPQTHNSSSRKSKQCTKSKKPEYSPSRPKSDFMLTTSGLPADKKIP